MTNEPVNDQVAEEQTRRGRAMLRRRRKAMRKLERHEHERPGMVLLIDPKSKRIVWVAKEYLEREEA